MTRITKLTLAGFKSFAHKTDIQFDSKYNCIIGPNGSGKSNIGDALCFVLGRLSAKSMRAEKAVNLIFNGGKKGDPAEKATVELTFDNQKKTFPVTAAEVTISRTITQKGASVYRLNGEKKTRTELLDFLSIAKINPDGYNIILQGDINRFVEMPPVERRNIIEEISDVSLYEEKKHKALLDLEKVDQKLNDAEIILKERSTYLRELKKDRDQALQFKEVKDRVDSHKATILHAQMMEKIRSKEEYEKDIQQHQQAMTAMEQKIAQLKQDQEQHQQELKEVSKNIEEKGEKAQLQVHKKAEELKVQLAKEKSRAQTLEDELGKISQRKEQFVRELRENDERGQHALQQEKTLAQQIARLERDREEISSKSQGFKAKHHLEQSGDMEATIEQLDKELEKRQEEVQHIRQQQQELLREKDRIEFQLQSIDQRLAKMQQVEKEHKQQLNELQQKKSEFTKVTTQLNSCLEQDSSYAAQLAHARSSVLSLQEQEVKLRARAESVKEGLARNAAVQHILNQKRSIKGIYGTIAELGTVKKNYQLPMEVAAGSRADYIVVGDDQVAAHCIAALKKNKLGSASFIPLNTIKANFLTTEDKKLARQDGVHDFALNLISFDKKFEKAFAFVFGNTLVVDTIEAARRVGVGTVRMVTLEGDLAESTGVMRGGFLAKKVASRFVSEDALEELHTITDKLGEQQTVVASLETKRMANEKEIDVLRRQKHELEGVVVTLEKTLHLDHSDLDASKKTKEELRQSLQQVDNQLRQVQQSLNVINKDFVDFKSKKQELRSQVSQLRDPSLLAQLQAFEETRQKYRDEITTLRSQNQNSEQNRKNLLGPEREKITEILKQQDKEAAAFQQERQALQQQIKLREKEVSETEKELTQFYAQYKNLFAQREKVTLSITKNDQQLARLQEQNRGHEIEVNKISLKNAEVKARLAGLEEEFRRYKGVPILSNKKMEELQGEIHRFEALLSKMSAVNMKALEIYEQVEAEYTGLMTKKEKLVGERTDVLTLMNEIETKKKEQFMRVFKTTNEHFQKIFSALYTKGTAELQLENTAQPFAGGVDIRVKLSGRRFLDIKSLSGGEKTLTALAFIFSIQEHQPASFYILDEIDAALDKQNSEKLSKLITSYADRAQYIAVSHNDSVIGEADTLYGVAMDERGMSKVTSLRL